MGGLLGMEGGQDGGFKIVKRKAYVTQPAKTWHVGTQNFITFSNFCDS